MIVEKKQGGKPEFAFFRMWTQTDGVKKEFLFCAEKKEDDNYYM